MPRPLRRVPPLPLLLLMLAFAPSAAAGAPPAPEALLGGLLELVAPRVSVVFDDAALEPFARAAAARAEAALDALAPRLGAPSGRIVLRLSDRSDVYNALAQPLPRPTVSLRALEDAGGVTGRRSPDALALLVTHELTHLLQYGLDGGDGAARLGVLGEGVAAVPPAWLVEGLAVRTEGLAAGGGRLEDARVLGLLDALALEGRWPTLAEASRAYEPWPGGETRYALGGSFAAFLEERHPPGALRAALERFDAMGPLAGFADAWAATAGTDLREEWAEHEAAVRARAEARAARLQGAYAEAGLEPPAVLGGDGSRPSAGPAWSPDGARLAYLAGGDVRVARVLPDGSLADDRLVRARARATRVSWLDDATLLLARLEPAPGAAWGEAAALDVASGRLELWTRGARAARAVADPAGGGALFAADDPRGTSTLRRARPGGPARGEPVWSAPAGARIEDLAPGPDGRVALALREDGRTRLAVLDPAEGRLERLGADVAGAGAGDADAGAAVAAPAWDGPDALLFETDRGGRVGVARLELATGRVTDVVRTLGGAFAPAPEPGGGRIAFLDLGGSGSDLALARVPPGSALGPARALARPEPAPPPALPDASAWPVRPYRPLPTLAPHAWLPWAGPGAGALPAVGIEVLGEDASGRVAWTATIAWDPALDGHLGGSRGGNRGGAILTLRAGLRQGGLLQDGLPLPAASAGLTAGVALRASPAGGPLESALGVWIDATRRAPAGEGTALARLEVGLAHRRSDAALRPEARLDLAWSDRRADAWGIVTAGTRASLTLAGRAAADGGAGSGRAWLDLATAGPIEAAPLPDGWRPTWEAALRAGRHAPPPVPAALSATSATLSLGVRAAAPVGLAWRDGRWAWERLGLEPTVRAWTAAGGGVGAGADLAVRLDLSAMYGAPLSVEGRAGIAAGRGWWRLGARLPR